MSPQRIIERLQKEWDEHEEYTEDGFKDYVCQYVDDNDEVGYLNIEGVQTAVVDYVMNMLSFER